MKEIKFEVIMQVEDNFVEDAKKFEHHADYILDLNSYPEIKSVYGCKITPINTERSNHNEGSI